MLWSRCLALPAGLCPARLSPAGPCLITQYGVIAHHSYQHRTFRQGLDFGRGAGLLGGAVFHQGGQGALSELAVAQPLSQSIAIMRAAAGGIEHPLTRIIGPF